METRPRTSLAGKVSLHKDLVIGQVAALFVSVWLLTRIGFAVWTYASLAVAVILMLTSVMFQLWWILREGHTSRHHGGPGANGTNVPLYVARFLFATPRAYRPNMRQGDDMHALHQATALGADVAIPKP